MGTPMTYISGNTGAYQSGTFNKGTIDRGRYGL